MKAPVYAMPGKSKQLNNDAASWSCCRRRFQQK
jgi:hypothetical protein